jgi:hypothetical protein
MFESAQQNSAKGQATVEYVMIAGLVAALTIYVLSLFYTGKDIESLVNAWGDSLARQVAGDRINAQGDGWAEQ